MLFRDADRALQLAVTGPSLFRPIGLMTDALVDDGTVRSRLQALAWLNHVLASGRFPRPSPGDDPRCRRLRLVLRALDGWRAGAGHRDIAIALFGAARVEADWADPRDHLRDRVRRAIRRGRALMDGGYRAFLW